MMNAIYFFGNNQGKFSQFFAIPFQEVSSDFPTSGLRSFNTYMNYRNNVEEDV